MFILLLSDLGVLRDSKRLESLLLGTDPGRPMCTASAPFLLLCSPWKLLQNAGVLESV